MTDTILIFGLFGNGAKVIFKHMDHNKNELLFYASKAGGKSLFNDNEYSMVDLSNKFISEGVGGAGNYSQVELNSIISGSNIDLKLELKEYQTTLSGSSLSSTTDIEALLKLIHINLNNPRITIDDIQIFKAQIAPEFENYRNNPALSYLSQKDKVNSANINRVTNLENMSKFTYTITEQNIERVFNKTFGNVNGMTFFFIGNGNMNDIKHLAEVYIGSLKGGEKQEWIQRDNIKDTEMTYKYDLRHLNNEVYVNITNYETKENNYNTYVKYRILSDAIRYGYIKDIYKELDVIYTINDTLRQTYTPNGNRWEIITNYNCNDYTAPSLKIIKEQLHKIADDGISTDAFNESLRNIINEFELSQSKNEFWLEKLKTMYIGGI